MKLVVTADVHLGLWSQFSTRDEEGVPSRLKNYTVLADDLVALAHKRKCDAIVLAGDLCQSATSEPAVHFYLHKFIETICSTGLPVYLIHGQHDSSSKSLTNSLTHSILSTLAGKFDNLHYAYTPSMFVLGGELVVHARSWAQGTPDVASFPEADLFIGHGLVQKATDPFGYQFMYGFNSEALLDKYRLSIIGDIHSKQTFGKQSFTGKDESAVVLIPGAPIQNTWKDDPDCGVWICELVPNFRGPILEFVPIYSLRDDGTYHRFLYVNDGELVDGSYKNVHVRPNKVSKPDARNLPHTHDESNNALHTALLCLAEMSLPNTMEIKQTLVQAWTKIKPTPLRVPQKQQVLAMRVKKFLSINELDIDFTKFPNEVLIVGPNGCGKTAIAEALYFGLTGRMTRDLTLTELYNWNFKEAFYIEIDLLLGEKKYRVISTRDGGPQLSVVDLQTGEIFKKETAPKTQQMIYDMLGVNDEDILLTSYFSVEKLATFGSMKASARHDMMGRFASIDQLESLRELLALEGREISMVLTGLAAQEKLLLQQLETIQEQLRYAKNDKPVDRTSLDAQLLTVLGGNVSALPVAQLEDTLKKKVAELDASFDDEAVKGHRACLDSCRKVENEIKSRNERLELIEESIGKIEEHHHEAEKGTCPTCHQPISDKLHEYVLNKFQEDHTTLLDEATALKTQIVELNGRLETLHLELDVWSEKIEGNSKIDAALKKLQSAIDLVTKFNQQTGDAGVVVSMLLQQVQSANIAHTQTKTKLDIVQKQTDTLKFCTTKLLARAGPVAARMTATACQLLEEEVNQIAGDHNLYKCRVVAGEEIEVMASFSNGKWTNLRAMSSGQRRLTDILLTVALRNLFTIRYGLENGILGLAIFDELFTFLDEEFTETAYTALAQCKTKLKLVVTHDPALMANFNDVIKVRLVNGNSEYRLP